MILCLKIMGLLGTCKHESETVTKKLECRHLERSAPCSFPWKMTMGTVMRISNLLSLAQFGSCLSKVTEAPEDKNTRDFISLRTAVICCRIST